MPLTFDLQPLLATKSTDEQADFLNSLLAGIGEKVKEDQALSKLMRYNVKAKGENEERRRSQLLRYKGPDPETLKLLADHHIEWLRNPFSFWVRPSPPNLVMLPPQAQIVGCFLATKSDDAWSAMIRVCTCILLLEFQDKHKNIMLQPEAIAQSLSEVDAFKQKNIRQTIERMINAGSRYRNLEAALGLGAALVIGTDIAETTWSKILPKKDKKFREVVKHLKTTPLPASAVRYAKLRKVVVDAQLNYFGEMSAVESRHVFTMVDAS